VLVVAAVVELLLLLLPPPQAVSANGASAPNASVIVNFFIRNPLSRTLLPRAGGESNADLLNGR